MSNKLLFFVLSYLVVIINNIDAMNIMIKWLLILPLIGIPIVFLSMNDFQEKEMKTGPELGKASIIEVGQEFIKQASLENPTEENILGMFREITAEEILKETKLPDLKESEKILNNGIRLTTNYNQISYDYSVGKFDDKEYFSKLFDFRIKYEKYMTAIDSYIGNEDILTLKNSMIQELKEINQQIALLKNKSVGEGWEPISEYDKYKKFLPSMFTP